MSPRAFPIERASATLGGRTFLSRRTEQNIPVATHKNKTRANAWSDVAMLSTQKEPKAAVIAAVKVENIAVTRDDPLRKKQTNNSRSF